MSLSFLHPSDPIPPLSSPSLGPKSLSTVSGDQLISAPPGVHVAPAYEILYSNWISTYSHSPPTILDPTTVIINSQYIYLFPSTRVPTIFTPVGNTGLTPILSEISTKYTPPPPFKTLAEHVPLWGQRNVAPSSALIVMLSQTQPDCECTVCAAARQHAGNETA